MNAIDLCSGPTNPLAAFYRRSRVSERLLLTGHSHQAWPDCGFDGQREAWLDAAEYLDRKWERAFEKADRVREGYSRLLDDSSGHIALGSSTHELVVRFLSALPLKTRPRIVTTDGEFHSLRRQLDRLAEEGLEVVRVGSSPSSRVVERLIPAIDDRTAAVMVSSVFYHSGEIVRELGRLMERCRRVGAELLVDAYHALNVVPFSLGREGLEDAFVVGGGYKYCQLGEGNGFLRFPRHCRMRPVVTGWYSELGFLESVRPDSGVAYGDGPSRFAGATYDPTSHYRAAKVLEFFKTQGLDPGFLREVSQHQMGLLVDAFDRLDADPRLISRDRSVPLEALGGFLVLRSPRAPEIRRLLAEHGVQADHRQDRLRLGPAPYLSDDQLRESMEMLSVVLRRAAGGEALAP